ncbi:hypothetical protein QJQ45_024225 [Haematococcus lacustris]|nr:hypothetical protein QJQ45_024225 [Haematococcus lacustris]
MGDADLSLVPLAARDGVLGRAQKRALEGGAPVDLHGDASTAMGGIVPGMRASMPAAARLPGLMGAATSPGRKKRSNEAAVAELEELIGHMMQLPQQSWRASTGGLGMMSQAPPRPHGIARQSLLLKLPSAQDSRRLDLPAMVADRFGHACLVVLPSDKPSTRAEALALEDLLVEVLREPVKAVHRQARAGQAAAWRASTLNSLCSEALMAVNEGLHGSHLGPRPLGQSWACRAAAEAPPGATLGPPAPSSIPVLLAGGEMSHAAMTSQQAPGQLVQAIGSDTEAGGPGQESGAAVARAQGGPEAAAHLRVTLALGLAVATTVCMADAIRQVEVHCSERGRVMAYTWNAFLTSHEGALAALQGENAQLAAHNRQDDASTLIITWQCPASMATAHSVTSININTLSSVLFGCFANTQLREEVAELHNQVEGVDFLRKSCKAFRAEVERSAEEAGSLLKEVLEQRQVVEEVSQAFRQTEDLVSRQLARLRWQHALHLLGCRHRQPVLVSGGQGPKGSPAALPAKIALLSRLGAQVAHAQQRKRLHGVQQLWSQFEGKATLQELVKSALHASHQLPWTAASLTESPEQLLARLPALQIEAQVLVLASMKDAIRAEVLRLMTAEQRAELVVAMSREMFGVTKQAVGPSAWKDTMAAIQASGTLAARLLRVVDTHAAVLEFSNWSTEKQLEVMMELDSQAAWHTAAQVLRCLPVNMRRGLLNQCDPALAARTLQMLGSAEQMIDVLEGLSEQTQARILGSMAPDRAAAVLQALSPEQAARKLMKLKALGQHEAVLEHLPPKLAASVLMTMEELGREAAALAHRSSAGPPQPAGPEQANRQSTTQAAAAQTQQLPPQPQLMADNSSVKPHAISDPAAGPIQEGSLVGSTLLSMPSASAQNILAFLGLQDKAGLLAGLQPGQVVQMLALMPATDAVALLAALSDAGLNMVADALSEAERLRLRRALGSAEELAGSDKRKGKKVGRRVSTLVPDDIDTAKTVILEEAYATAVDTIVADVDDGGETSRSGAGTRERGGRARRGIRYSETGAEGVSAASLRRLSMSGIGEEGDSDFRSSPNLLVSTLRHHQEGGGQPGDLRRFSLQGVREDVEEKEEQNLEEEETDATVALERGDGTRKQLSDAPGDTAVNGSPSAPRRRLVKSKSDRGGAPRGKGPSRMSVTGKPTADVTADAKVVKAARAALKSSAEGQVALKAAKARMEAAKVSEDAWTLALESSGGGAVEPQSKLGKLPKNQRLKDAMAQHKNAKPKPKNWLMAVVDTVYKDGGWPYLVPLAPVPRMQEPLLEQPIHPDSIRPDAAKKSSETILKKLGRLEALRKQSVPEIVFGYFHNKYGQKNVVNEYVGSLVNTLTLYKASDLRLEVFARFLSEEWDFATFCDFLTAQRMLLEPSKVVCIEYAREASKDEAYAWLDLYKCISVADSLMGPRSPDTRSGFLCQLQQAAVQVDDAEVEVKVRRDKRFEGEVLPAQFFKLPRIKFISLLCSELQRINTFITTLAEDKFARLDVERTGQVAVSSLPSYLAQMLPAATPAAVLEEVQHAFLQLAGAMEKDVPADSVAVADVVQLSLEHFVLATLNSMPIRDHIKAALLPPPRAKAEFDEAEVLQTYLFSVVRRHAQYMLPHFQAWLAESGKDSLLQEKMLAVTREAAGLAKLRAYLSLLAAILNLQVVVSGHGVRQQGRGGGAVSTSIDGVLDCTDPSQLDSRRVEESVARLEDVVIILLHQDKYLLATDEHVALDRIRRQPAGIRLVSLGATCKASAWGTAAHSILQSMSGPALLTGLAHLPLQVHRQFSVALQHSASYVFQSLWHARKARLAQANQMQDFACGQAASHPTKLPPN